MFKVTVFVQYLESVVNPDEEVLNEAIQKVGTEGVSPVKIGRTYTFHVQADRREEVEQKAKELAGKLLVNPSMETYSVEMEEV